MSQIKKSSLKVAQFGDRFLHYTEQLIYNLTRFYFICSIAELALCAYALHQGFDSPLTTFITESNTTFRNTVGVAIIKFLVENVFQYNSFFGIEKKGIKANNNESEDQLGAEVNE